MAPLSYDLTADEELIPLARRDDELAFQQLLDRYAPMVKSRVRAFTRAGLEADDLAQEGMIGLLGAIRVFDQRQASFSTFARLCIDRMLIAAARQAGRQKRIPPECLVAEGPDDRPIKDFLASGDEDNPESILIAREEAERLRRRADETLSEFEYQVLSAYLSGDRYEEIAQRLASTSKAVDNALQRIRRKMKP